jgi:hypothetical protein
VRSAIDHSSKNVDAHLWHTVQRLGHLQLGQALGRCLFAAAEAHDQVDGARDDDRPEKVRQQGVA